MSHLDLSYVLSNVSDEPAFIGQLLEVFLQGLDEDIPELESSLESGDHEAIKRIVHKIKSGFRSLGMAELTTMLQEIEDAARTQNDIDAISDKVHRFTDVLPVVRSEIADYIQSHEK